MVEKKERKRYHTQLGCTIDVAEEFQVLSGKLFPGIKKANLLGNILTEWLNKQKAKADK